jgi:Terminase RNaseH-like domain
MIGWDDVPHLTAESKAQLKRAYPRHELAARSLGIPVLGSGPVFQGVDEAQIIIEPVSISPHWVQLGAMDFGWDHPWAAVRMAWDRDADVVYLTRDFRKSETTPARARTELAAWDLDWLPWAWPHDGLQHDKGSGQTLRDQYEKAGFLMMRERAQFEGGGHGFEAGIQMMIDRMESGRWKVFSTCTSWIDEFRTYHRKDGQVIKERDDTISASRIGMMMLREALQKPKRMAAKLRINTNWKAS